MTAPRIILGTLVELTADLAGFLTEDDAREATRGVDADNGPALVLIGGVLLHGASSAAAARHVGAALATAERIDIRGKGPGLSDFARLVQAAAIEERAFRLT
jgi:hypothetical protein